MSIAPGVKLGHYEIVALIGAGGMGEVYRARDPQLKREVAIKVLPTIYGSDSERLLRFQQEAEATAALNHPNILSVYQIGAQNGTHFIVTELLHGETLRAALATGPLPVRKTLECACAVAQGLSAAHERGIVHRDLKPENLFLTREGHVKILDFGLAKLTQPHSDSEDCPTVDIHTGEDRVLGTVGYMAPEQLRGQPIDGRTDIFALGAILYEMLSGRRPFQGPTAVDTQTAILKEEPAELSSPTRPIPPSLCRIVRHCLEKIPERRFQSARDLAFQLESSISALDSGDSGSASATLPAALHEQKLRPASSWALAGALAIAIAGGSWWMRGLLTPKSTFSPVHFERLTSLYGMEESPTISPDGKSLAFVSDATGSRQIYVRLLAGGSTLQLTQGNGDHLGPRWARDSSSIFYYTPPAEVSQQATVWQIPALGGQPRRVVDSLSEADESHDGKSLAFFRLGDAKVQLVRSDTGGASPQVLAEFPAKTGCRQPRWSPNDSEISFIKSSDRWDDDIYIVPAAGGEPSRVTRQETLISGYSWLPDDTGFLYSTSLDSTMLYLPSQNLERISRKGDTLQQLTFGDDDIQFPDVDPQGRVTASRRRITSDIWKIPVGPDAADNVRLAIRITHQTSRVHTPSLSPDDKQIAYLAGENGHGNLWILDLASNQSRQLTFEEDPRIIMGVPVWNPDGSVIAYARQEADRKTNYYLVRPDGSDNHLFLENATWFTWSPDGKWGYYINMQKPNDLSSERLMKSPLSGGPAVEVRKGVITGPAVARDGAVYYSQALDAINGLWDYDIRVAKPENAEPRTLARIPGSRVPDWQGMHPVLSHDGKWIAIPLSDRWGTNVWILSTETGQLRRITDFGDRRTFIVRRLSWTTDDKYIFAAVGEGDADIVMMEGLLH